MPLTFPNSNCIEIIAATYIYRGPKVLFFFCYFGQLSTVKTRFTGNSHVVSFLLLSNLKLIFHSFCEHLYLHQARVKYSTDRVRAFRRKMLKPPIARLPAIKQDLSNRQSGETNNIYRALVN